DSQHAGLALARSWHGLKWILGAAHSWHAINSQRSLSAPGLHDILTGRYRGKTLQLFTEFTTPLNGLGRYIERLREAQNPPTTPQTPDMTEAAEGMETTARQAGKSLSGLAPFARFAWV